MSKSLKKKKCFVVLKENMTSKKALLEGQDLRS